jgi:hypothetical protein
MTFGTTRLQPNPTTHFGRGVDSSLDGCRIQRVNSAWKFLFKSSDLIRRNSRVFGVAFSEGHVLTTVDPVDHVTPAFNQFDDMCGQVLITQELPFAGTSGLSGLSWNGTVL